MAGGVGDWYIRRLGDTVKITWVRNTVGVVTPVIRNSEHGKAARNLSRARSEFLELGQSNHWDCMATFTSGECGIDYSVAIRGIQEWLHSYNHNHGCHIKYLMVFELGSETKRLHAHALLADLPSGFYRRYVTADYRSLPADLKRLYRNYKLPSGGTRLGYCPAWRHGWSTIVPIDGSPKVVSYMTKYMTKGNVELTTVFGGHAYFASKGLFRPQKKKIPSLAAGTVAESIPNDAWKREYVLNGVYDELGRLLSGDVMTTCYILDRDKISSSLWNYYTALYDSLQG